MNRRIDGAVATRKREGRVAESVRYSQAMREFIEDCSENAVYNERKRVILMDCSGTTLISPPLLNVAGCELVGWNVRGVHERDEYRVDIEELKGSVKRFQLISTVRGKDSFFTSPMFFIGSNAGPLNVELDQVVPVVTTLTPSLVHPSLTLQLRFSTLEPVVANQSLHD